MFTRYIKKSMAARRLLVQQCYSYVQLNTNSLLENQWWQRQIKEKLHLFDPLGIKIAQAFKNQDRSNIMKLFNKYIFDNEQKNPQQIIGLINILDRFKDGNFDYFALHLLEFILRSPSIDIFVCTSRQLMAILKFTKMKLVKSNQKRKEFVIRYKTSQLISANIKRIDIISIKSVIEFLLRDQTNYATSRKRFMGLAAEIHEVVYKIFDQYIQNGKSWSKEQQVCLNRTVYDILLFFKDYPPKNDVGQQKLYKFIDHYFFINNKSSKKIVLYHIYKCFPSSAINSEGIYYKDILLSKILGISKQRLQQSQEWHDGFLAYSILSFQFYKMMNSLQFRYQGDLNYLIRQDIKIPTLSERYWQRYNASPSTVNKDHIGRNIIEKIYPDKFIKTSQQQSMTIFPPAWTDNQIKVRMKYALDKLGLQSKQEVLIGGRYVDFLIGDTIIQCDGDHHFELYSMEYNESTHFRNLSLLLYGYKILLINIFEYNANRTTTELAALISHKLQAMNKLNAIMIL